MASQSFTRPSTRPWFPMKIKSITSWFHIQVFLWYLNILLCWKENNGQNEIAKFQVVDFIGHFFQVINAVMFCFVQRAFSRWMNHSITMLTYMSLGTWDLKSFNLRFGYFYLRIFFILGALWTPCCGFWWVQFVIITYYCHFEFFLIYFQELEDRQNTITNWLQLATIAQFILWLRIQRTCSSSLDYLAY